MDRAFKSGASGTPPTAPVTPSVGYPISGNPGTGTPATKPGPWWYHMMTEEMRAVIVAAGITPDQTDTTQLRAAIQVLIAAGISPGQQPGEVCGFARNTAPIGFLKANGALVSRTTYASLFSSIGTNFGAGDGSTTFAVPDLRGEFIRGWDDSRGVDSGRLFGSVQLDSMQGHVHNVSESAPGATTASSGGGGYVAYASFAARASTSPVSDGTNGTPRTTAETRPRSVALLACIKY